MIVNMEECNLSTGRMEKKPKKILPGLTTTPGSDWRGKVVEMKRLGIREIALFPTYLKKEERKELYRLLEGFDGLSVPHIHLRDDMDEAELAYLGERFRPAAYNTHESVRGKGQFLKYRDMIFIENHFHLADEVVLEKYAGMCLDTQHLHRSRFEAPIAFFHVMRLLRSGIPVGCSHISPMPLLRNRADRKRRGVGGHYMIDLSELEYVSRYAKYLPGIVSIEMENSFEEQLWAKETLERIING